MHRLLQFQDALPNVGYLYVKFLTDLSTLNILSKSEIQDIFILLLAYLKNPFACGERVLL